MNVNTDRRVGGRVLPIVTLPSGGAAVKYVYMQSLAKIFWQHTDTMKISYDLVRVGLQVTVRTFMKRSLDGITEDDFAVLLATHKTYIADPLDGAKTRRISLLPLANAIKIARLREIPSTAFFLRSLGEEAPTMHEAPKQCKQQRRLDRLEHIAMTRTLPEEIAARPVGDESESDDEKGRRVLAVKPGKKLRRQLAAFKEWRMASLNLRREGIGVASSSVKTEVALVKRWLGWLKEREREAPRHRYDLRCFCDENLGKLFETYGKELLERGRKHTTVAGYIHSAYMVTQYVFRDEDEAQPSQVELVNMRSQMERETKRDKVWAKRSEHWLSWAEAQTARIKACKEYKRYRATNPAGWRKKAKLCRAALLVSLMTTVAPDRVGVIRQLKVHSSLCQDDDSGIWYVDLRDCPRQHKTSARWGPTVTRFSQQTSKLIDEYLRLKRYICKSDAAERTPFLWFAGNTDKLMGAAQFSILTGQTFLKLTGKRCTMALLRQAFVTWIRSQDDVPQVVLDSTSAAMKHAEETDRSSVYDRGLQDKVNSAAFKFATEFAERFEKEYTGNPCTVAAVAEPPIGAETFMGPKWSDVCIECQDADVDGTLVMCDYCPNVVCVDVQCSRKQPVSIQGKAWWCSACNASFARGKHNEADDDETETEDDGDETKTQQAAAVARSSAVAVVTQPEPSDPLVAAAITPMAAVVATNEARETVTPVEPVAPSVAPVSVEAVAPAKGMVVVVKTEGATPFKVGRILTEPAGPDLECDVHFYSPTCAPPMRLNLTGPWGSDITKLKGGRQKPYVLSVLLAWTGLAWGDERFLCSDGSSSNGIPALSLATLTSLNDNASLSWKMKKRKACADKGPKKRRR
jgi:hypothetical protein